MFFLNNRKWADTDNLPISVGRIRYLIFAVLAVVLSGQLSLSYPSIPPNSCQFTIRVFLNLLQYPESTNLGVRATPLSLLFSELTPFLLIRVYNHFSLIYMEKVFLNRIRLIRRGTSGPKQNLLLFGQTPGCP